MSLENIKTDFPIFTHHPELVYLDSAATSLKPQVVINAITDYYSKYSANIARGIYPLSEQATESYEQSRQTIARFISAKPSEIIFVRNTTEAINLVAYSWGLNNLIEEDEIVLTEMEHHANILPWQQLKKHKHIKIKYVPLNAEGLLEIDKLNNLLSERTKLIALTQVSNVLGTINPIEKLIPFIKKRTPRALILIDGAQAVPHLPIDINRLQCDFYCFSGHKMLGPTGIGVLFARESILQELPPFLTGGSMIEKVDWQESTFRDSPYRFEAGTPHIAGVIGLAAAANYLQSIGLENIRSHTNILTQYAMQRLADLSEIKILGSANLQDRSAIVSFYHPAIHAHDIAQILANQQICVRAGHHCAMPLHNRFNITGSVRASFYLYNTQRDIDVLIENIKQAIATFTK